MAEEFPRHAGGQIHGGVVFLDVDSPDESPFEPRLVGDGAHDLPRGHAVPVAHLDAMPDHLGSVAVTPLRTGPALLPIARRGRPRPAVIREAAWLAPHKRTVVALTTLAALVGAPLALGKGAIVRRARPCRPRRVAAPITRSPSVRLAPEAAVWALLWALFWAPIWPPFRLPVRPLRATPEALASVVADGTASPVGPLADNSLASGAGAVCLPIPVAASLPGLGSPAIVCLVPPGLTPSRFPALARRLLHLQGPLPLELKAQGRGDGHQVQFLLLGDVGNQAIEEVQVLLGQGRAELLGEAVDPRGA